MGKWSREEIEDAFQHYLEVNYRRFASGWNPEDLQEWVLLFTEDVVYRDYGFGFNDGKDVEINGRDEVLKWIMDHRAMGFPWTEMRYYIVPWYMIDEDRGWVILQWLNRMEDPGDGSIHEEKSYCRVKYAGNNQWCFQEGIYNPVRMRNMVDQWVEAKRRLDGSETTAE